MVHALGLHLYNNAKLIYSVITERKSLQLSKEPGQSGSNRDGSKLMVLTVSRKEVMGLEGNARVAPSGFLSEQVGGVPGSA